MAFGLYIGSFVRNRTYDFRADKVIPGLIVQAGVYTGAGFLYDQFMAPNGTSNWTNFLSAGCVQGTLNLIGMCIATRARTSIQTERAIVSAIELVGDSILYALISKISSLTFPGNCFFITALFVDAGRLVYHTIEACKERILQEDGPHVELEEIDQEHNNV